MIRDRGDWVISRQRLGVAYYLLRRRWNFNIMTAETIEHVAQLWEFGSKSSERDAKDLRKKDLLIRFANGEFKKRISWTNMDRLGTVTIMEWVWITVPGHNAQQILPWRFGQYRGWFSSSYHICLLTMALLTYKQILSQDFAHDNQRWKCLNLSWNTIAQVMLKNNWCEILRLWVTKCGLKQLDDLPYLEPSLWKLTVS